MRVRFIAIGILLCICLKGKAELPVLKLDDFVPMDLTPFAGLYTDSSGALTIDHFLADPIAFSPTFKEEHSIRYPTALWLRIDLISGEDISNKWLILKGPNNQYPFLSNIDYVQVYFVQHGEVVSYHKSGTQVPRSEKSLQERAAVNIVPFFVKAGELTSIFIRFSSASKTDQLYLRPTLSDPIVNISYTKDGMKRLFFSVQGMFLVIGIYVLVFWFFVRHKSYLYFAGFCFVYTLHHLHIFPFSSMIDLFFPEAPHLAGPIHALSSWGSMFLLLVFGLSFSEVEDKLPRWTLYYRIIIGIYVLLSIYGILLFLYKPYPVDEGNFTLAFLMVLPVSIRFVGSRYPLARIFGIGIIWFICWRIAGVITDIRFFFAVGQLGLLLLYALGLGYKLMENERQKAHAQHLRQLDAVKSKFFANISHEFRTPLSLILGPLHRALEKITSNEEMEENATVSIKGKHLKMMQRNALRLQNLVSQILDLSKLDQGKMQLRLENGDIIAFIRVIVSSFESLAEHKHIRFNVSLPKTMEQAYFDRYKLETLLVNLLTNAFKFTPDYGTVAVRVEDIVNFLKIVVSDTGKGMTAAETTRIFERFYQIEASNDLGTGIGLSLVKELVELHHGTIQVKSTVGQGTEFEIRLPHIRSYLQDKATNHISPTSASSDVVHLFEEEEIISQQDDLDNNLSIVLIIEDNNDLRTYISEELGDTFQIQTAKDGQEGLEMAESVLPDLIISDVMMPKMDGLALCQHLKQDIKTSHIPIILLTAKAGQEAKIEGLETGADDYLIKPFDGRELKIKAVNMIEQSLRMRKKFSSELKIRPSEVTVCSMDEKFIQEVTAEIEKNIGNEAFTVEELAMAVGFSPSQLNRKLKALTNTSSIQMIRYFRLIRAKELLEQDAASVSEVAYLVGYNNLSYFSKSYKNAFGILPSDTKAVK